MKTELRRFKDKTPLKPEEALKLNPEGFIMDYDLNLFDTEPKKSKKEVFSYVVKQCGQTGMRLQYVNQGRIRKRIFAYYVLSGSEKTPGYLKMPRIYVPPAEFVFTAPLQGESFIITYSDDDTILNFYRDRRRNIAYRQAVYNGQMIAAKYEAYEYEEDQKECCGICFLYYDMFLQRFTFIKRNQYLIRGEDNGIRVRNGMREVGRIVI